MADSEGNSMPNRYRLRAMAIQCVKDAEENRRHYTEYYEEQVLLRVREAQALGASYAQIGMALGLTKRGAHARYRPGEKR